MAGPKKVIILPKKTETSKKKEKKKVPEILQSMTVEPKPTAGEILRDLKPETKRGLVRGMDREPTKRIEDYGKEPEKEVETETTRPTTKDILESMKPGVRKKTGRGMDRK